MSASSRGPGLTLPATSGPPRRARKSRLGATTSGRFPAASQNLSLARTGHCIVQSVRKSPRQRPASTSSSAHAPSRSPGRDTPMSHLKTTQSRRLGSSCMPTIQSRASKRYPTPCRRCHATDARLDGLDLSAQVLDVAVDILIAYVAQIDHAVEQLRRRKYTTWSAKEQAEHCGIPVASIAATDRATRACAGPPRHGGLRRRTDAPVAAHQRPHVGPRLPLA